MPEQQRLYAIKRPDGSWYCETWHEGTNELMPPRLYHEYSFAMGAIIWKHTHETHGTVEEDFNNRREQLEAAGWRIVEVEVREVER